MDQHDQKVLKERARLLAQQKVDSSHAADKLSVVTFELIPEKYAIEDMFVRQVFTLTDLTPVPGTPSFIMGVTNHRGGIISIVNLKELFGIKDRGLTEMNKVLILSYNDMEFGVVADSVTGSRQISYEDVKALPATSHSRGSNFIKGMLSDGYILLNAAELMSSEVMLIKQSTHS